MKKLIFLLFCVLLYNPGFSKENIHPILIAQIEYTPNVEAITDSKVEAAFTLAAGLTENYKVISFPARDSVAAFIIKSGKEASVKEIAKRFDAGSIYFLKISRLAAMLRIEIAKTTLKNNGKSIKGIGYALLHYIDKKNNKYLYDPTLLQAIQRAMADVENDSLMFDKAEGSLKVFPAPTMVVGGTDFRDNPEFKSWDIFHDNVVNSYMAAELIFDVAKNSSNYVVYDISSRDSLYGLFNMHIVENYRPPTSYELDALTRLEVGYYLTGTLRRVESGAELELYLCKINKKQLQVITMAKDILKNDSIADMKELFHRTARKLFGFDVNN